MVMAERSQGGRGDIPNPGAAATTTTFRILSRDPGLDETWTGKEGESPGARPAAQPTHKNAASPRSVRAIREPARELVLTLYPDRPLLFGRDPRCDVVFPGSSVSREHARLWMREDGLWVVRDLGSRNGSYLRRGGGLSQGESVRLSWETPVMAGDWVLFAGGPNRIILEGSAADSSSASLATQSPAARRLEESLRICSRHRLPVFLIGPSGCGKTHVARFIHEASQRSGQFILVNCGRLPTDPAQLQSELLGHARGAFTGAIADRVGKFHAAHGGTLFLDEVEYLPPAAQDFLIDLLDGSGNFAPLGAPATQQHPRPDARIIAASKLSLAQSGLRADLCQRLAAADVIPLPTLDQRRDDIPGLVDEFLRQFGRQQAVQIEIEPDAVDLLQHESWPGQVRELEAAVKVTAAREYARLAGWSTGRILVVITRAALDQHLENRKVGFGTAPPTGPHPVLRDPSPAPPPPAKRRPPRELGADELRAALAKHGGNKTRAAAELGIAVNTLKYRMRACGVTD